LLGGRRGGVFTAAGVATGQATWALATSAGVSALLVASERGYAALKIVGAAYLIYLGGQALYGAIGLRERNDAGAAPAAARSLPPTVALSQGVISNLTNPKMAVFFPALLPQFVGEGDTSFLALLALGLLFSVMTLSWLTAYAFAVSKAGDFLRRPAARRLVQAATGAVLIALGLRLATEKD
jgi:threonine/homoserine/homoserine lactone efflux protein